MSSCRFYQLVEFYNFYKKMFCYIIATCYNSNFSIVFKSLNIACKFNCFKILLYPLRVRHFLGHTVVKEVALWLVTPMHFLHSWICFSLSLCTPKSVKINWWNGFVRKIWGSIDIIPEVQFFPIKREGINVLRFFFADMNNLNARKNMVWFSFSFAFIFTVYF